jgi:hypothetical protein
MTAIDLDAIRIMLHGVSVSLYGCAIAGVLGSTEVHLLPIVVLGSLGFATWVAAKLIAVLIDY